MEFYDVVASRHMMREFEDTKIEDAVIERIISAGMKAPSNDHMRDWHFVVVKDKETIHKLIEKIPTKISKEEIEALLRDWNLQDPCQQNLYRDAVPKQYRMLADASFIIVPLFKQKTDLLHPDSLSHLNGFASIWCCIENMFLAATNEGYACSMRIPLGEEGDFARQTLGFPKEYVMPCFIGVGKPSEHASHIVQKEYSVSERIHYDQW